MTISDKQNGSLERKFVQLTHLTYRPILEQIIQKELLATFVITDTRNGNNVIIDLGMGDGKYLLYELYRLIESCFVSIGGGTGDIIKDDVFNKKFRQLVTIHPDKNIHTILSFYRYGLWKDCLDEHNFPYTPMTSLWNFDKEFITNYRDQILELGTAGINTELLGTPQERSLLYAHDGSRDALAWTIKNYKDTTHFIGKMTIPAQCLEWVRNLAIAYLQKFRSPQTPIASPKIPYGEDFLLPASLLAGDMALTGDYPHDSKILKIYLSQRSDGKIIKFPGMFDEYLHRTCITYIGTTLNGGVYESGIFVPFASVDLKTKADHFAVVDTWQAKHPVDQPISLDAYCADLQI